MKCKNEEENSEGDKGGMPVCGDYLAGIWGSGVAELCKKNKDLGFLFGGYKILL